jgi:hypothetical protein
MTQIDTIIDALESAIKDSDYSSLWIDKVNKALSDARMLKALESKIDVWHDDCMKMPLNKFCRAWVTWSSYSTDGDSFQHGRTEAIVLKYKRNPDEDDFVFLHRGHKQYLHESFDIIKWQLLDTKPKRKQVTK